MSADESTGLNGPAANGGTHELSKSDDEDSQGKDKVEEKQQKKQQTTRDTNDDEGITIRHYKGVAVHFDANNWLVPPESDYYKLLHGLSKVPPDNLILYKNRVGIARVALLAGLLGCVFGSHLLMFVLAKSIVVQIWGLYGVIMCVYHWSEFLVTCYHHPHTATFDSFLVNQSVEFGIAIVASWIEFLMESLLFPSMKTDHYWISVIGVVIICIGQSIRTMAMIQAGPSFTHMVANKREPRHDLIRHGLYRVLRHPGYFGWFYWSVGTQLLLCNPLCAIAYFIVAQRFFASRIPTEEANLVKIFGHEYEEYKRRTWIGIPGIPA